MYLTIGQIQQPHISNNSSSKDIILKINLYKGKPLLQMLSVKLICVITVFMLHISGQFYHLSDSDTHICGRLNCRVPAAQQEI